MREEGEQLDLGLIYFSLSAGVPLGYSGDFLGFWSSIRFAAILVRAESVEFQLPRLDPTV